MCQYVNGQMLQEREQVYDQLITVFAPILEEYLRTVQRAIQVPVSFHYILVVDLRHMFSKLTYLV